MSNGSTEKKSLPCYKGTVISVLLGIIAGVTTVGAQPASGPLSSPVSRPESRPAAVSTRNSRKNYRDPFWPVGWRAATVSGGMDIGGASIDWRGAGQKLKVAGLSKLSNGRYFAILKNAGVVEKGDIISLNYCGLTYQWKIKDITQSGIVLEHFRVYKKRRKQNKN